MRKLKNPNLSIICGSHELEKVSDELRKTVKEDKNLSKETKVNVDELMNRLDEAFLYFHRLMRNPNDLELQKEIIDKYQHNIPSVYEEEE
jgi:hypothetical protein